MPWINYLCNLPNSPCCCCMYRVTCPTNWYLARSVITSWIFAMQQLLSSMHISVSDLTQNIMNDRNCLTMHVICTSMCKSRWKYFMRADDDGNCSCKMWATGKKGDNLKYRLAFPTRLSTIGWKKALCEVEKQNLCRSLLFCVRCLKTAFVP